MKLPIINNENKKVGEKTLPKQFNELYRADLIKRAVLALQSNRNVYGSDPRAGKKASARISKRRRDYRGSYGKGISRTPRKVMTKKGTQFNWTGAFAPNTVGGRRAHPPKSWKIVEQKINDKERKMALRSAIAASLNNQLISKRNHVIPTQFPFIISSEFENITKAKDFFKALTSLGFEKELARVKEKKIRAGKGKIRGRKYDTKKGPLIVVSKECPLLKAGKNIHGLEIVAVKQLNCELLAPGCTAGRLTLYTDASVDLMQKENLFMVAK
ncbi:50S ribosomal protein L4 [Candidatus Woesearchaeota archaeon]|nr:MAG: 50S ribosomal protein L4 [Candidatus Woesearchaeota archaeon]